MVTSPRGGMDIESVPGENIFKYSIKDENGTYIFVYLLIAKN